MKPYMEFQPTGFDARGLNADQFNIGHFQVLDVGRNRDSDTLQQSNWDCALECLGGESDLVQVHRFGHWGHGWFELILINPTADDKLKIGEECEDSIAEYAVLNDEHYSAAQWDAAAQWWEHCGIAERVRVCQKYRITVFAARHNLDTVSQLDNTGEMISYLGD